MYKSGKLSFDVIDLIAHTRSLKQNFPDDVFNDM